MERIDNDEELELFIDDELNDWFESCSNDKMEIDESNATDDIESDEEMEELEELDESTSESESDSDDESESSQIEAQKLVAQLLFARQNGDRRKCRWIRNYIRNTFL